VKVRGDCSCCVIVDHHCLGVIIGKNGKNIDDIMNTSLAKIIKVDQADVSVVMLLAY
jgi:predicted PilT family ATPase